MIKIRKPKLPSIRRPSIHLPAMRRPSIHLPSIRLPSVSLPSIKVPSVRVPSITVPSIKLPSIGAPMKRIVVDAPRSAIVSVWRTVAASPRAICITAPIQLYRRAGRARDWLLAKIEYLHSESAKWRAIWTCLKSPYTVLTRYCGLNPQMAIGLLFAGSTVGTGVVVNETVFAERSFARGDAGVFQAPVDTPVSYTEGENTLRIDLGSVPVREITIENVSVGTAFTGSALPSGEDTVVQISGNPAAEGFLATRLQIGTLIFEKSRCKTLTLSNSTAHTLIVTGNASDGQSLAPSPGTARMRAIGGGHHQAEAMLTQGGTYDRIWLQAPTTNVDGKIDTLRLTNLLTKGGGCVLSAIDADTIILDRNEIGAGNGFATKEFQILTTMEAANITMTDNVEVSIAEPATQ